jgi:murein DD-endopeptidase MepM/ murein hydrolase activator NlpD
VIRVIVAATVIVAGGIAALTGAGDVALGATAAGTAFVKPVHGAVISQGFGCTSVAFEPVDRACPGGHWHSGIDLAAAAGTPVYASGGGVAHVVAAAAGFGLHIVIDHGSGLQSLYGHLSAVTISDDSWVSSGQQIGAVGSTGNSTGPHLHFEFDRAGIAQDPRSLVDLP